MEKKFQLPLNKKIISITYWRDPTEWEIKFGYGAIHYKDFAVGLCLKKDGSIKRTIKCTDDGLTYRYPS